MTIKVRDNILLVLALCGCCILLSCQSKFTPLQISEKFWHAIQTENVDKVRKYSLKDSLDGIDKKENIGQINSISFGKIVIDGEIAEVETEVIVESGSIPLKTYLRIENNVWRVDYKKTINPLLVNQDMAELIDDIQILSEEFAKEIEGSVQEFKEKALPEIESKLEEAEREIREKLPELKNMIDEFLKELEKSIEEAIPPQDEVETQET